MSFVTPVKVRMTYRPLGHGMAGHTLPALHFHWSPGYRIPWHQWAGGEEDAPAQEFIRMHLPHDKAKALGYFWQGDSSNWLKLEFWTKDEAGVKRDIVNFYKNLLADHLDAE